MNKSPILNVTSEIGRLKTVLLHRPGEEIENLTPDLLERLLFDDIPYLKIAEEEHDKFANVLRSNGVEVVYLEDLSAEAIRDSHVKDKFIEEFLDEGMVCGESIRAALKEYLYKFSDKDLIIKLMAGVRNKDLTNYTPRTLGEIVRRDYPFILDPLPNLYFTRDPFATMGNGISLNHMRTETRNRETIFAKYIFKHHPLYKDKNIPLWFDRSEKLSLEGGDELVLSPKVLAIGISERSDALAIEKLAKNILYSDQSFETILAFDIPKKRAFMHLDTVFTMIDHDKFTIHPEIEGPLTVYSLSKDESVEGGIRVEREKSTLESILKKYLNLDNVTLIRCAGGDPIAAPREQWNDGSNTLALAPGEVIVYCRNHVTNKILREHGIKIHEIESSELSRGRGGPRCMSMPLFREDLT